jgi:transcriptional regulator with PAS, ATPase and Fis domain
VPLKISPLRDRRSSIIPMAEYYLNKFNKKYKFNKTISREALKYLFEYNWPGNVRELKNIIEMLTVTTVGDTINIEHLPIQILEWHNSEEPTNNYIKTKLSDAIDNLEKELILKSYERYGNVRDAAKELGIDPSTFVRKRKKFLD